MVRTIRRLIIVFLLVFLAVVVVALAYLHFANLNQYRDQISNQVSNLTGRHVTIGEVDVALWPAFTVTTNNIAVTNAPWGSQPNMAEIGHLSASVRPMSVLFGPVLLEDFTLENVSLLLEYDKQGKSNWVTTGGDEVPQHTANQASESGKGGVPVMLEHVRIRNLKLIRRQTGTPDQHFNLDNLTIETNKNDRLDVAVTGSILDLPLLLKGQFGTRQQLSDVGNGDLAMTGSLGDLRLEAKGRLALGNLRETSQVEMTVSSNDVASFLKAAGLSIPLSGTLRLKADAAVGAGERKIRVDGSLGEFNALATLAMGQDNNINIDGHLRNTDKLGTMLGVTDLTKNDISVNGALIPKDDALKLQDITITTGKSRITANGMLASGDGTLSLQVMAKGGILTDLMTNLPSLAYDGSIHLSLSPGEMKIDSLKLQFGASDLAGKVRVVGKNSKMIEVHLVSKNLDLIEYYGPEKKDGSQPQSTAAKEPAKTEPASNKKYVFSEGPLPFDQLQHREVDFDLSIGKLATSALTLNKVKAKGSLHKGILKGEFGFKTPEGGISRNKIVLDASNRQASLQAQLDARDLPLKALSGHVKDIKEIPMAGLTADLKSSGNTPHALATKMNGKLTVIVGSGLIDNTILSKVSADLISQLISALNPFAKRDPYSRLDCSVMALNIKGGTSTIDNLLVQNKKVMIVAAGKVDLKSEKLDIEFNTKPREGVGISADMFVTPFVVLRGTLVHPSIDLNKKGTILTMGAALATGGLSLALRGGIDRVAGEADQCAALLPKYPLPPLADN